MDTLEDRVRLVNSSPGDGELLNDVLTELRKEGRADLILPFLRSGRRSIVAAGLFWASELGVEFFPFIDSIGHLFSSNYMPFRFRCLDICLACALRLPAAYVVAVADRVSDPEEIVGARALCVLASVPEDVFADVELDVNQGWIMGVISLAHKGPSGFAELELVENSLVRRFVVSALSLPQFRFKANS